MAFPVQQLLNQKQKPVSVPPVELADAACRLMREHGFSQLPVVSDKGVVIGLVTQESILRALGHFNVALDRLRVSAALMHPRKFFPDDDLFDLLDALSDEYATIIVDKEDRLLGIVTQDDLLVYFRKRAEDMLLVEEIELCLREHVLCAFSDQVGSLARQELCTAVDEVADQASRFRKKFQRALGIYLAASKAGVVDEGEADKAFRVFELKYRAKELKDLTFEETRALLFQDSRWSAYGSVFGIEKKALSDLLERARDARNKLAHFRGDLSDEEREKLRFCAQFLDDHRPQSKIPQVASIREVPTAVPPPLQAPSSAVVHQVSPTPTAVSPTEQKKGGCPEGTQQILSSIEDEQDFEESRYAPLVAHLTRLSDDAVSFRFEEVESILGHKLPPAARRHRAWWANDRVSHAQSRLWLEAGWRVSGVNVTTENVSFTRIKGREEAYIDFFSRLLHESQRIGSPNGANWQVIERISGGSLSTLVVASFARGGRFRIELYIDLPVRDETRRKETNKKLFDLLAAQRDEIEGKLGHSLGWERLDHRTASRIALYTDGSILDGKEALHRLVKWAVQMIPRFVQAIAAATHGNLLLLEKKHEPA